MTHTQPDEFAFLADEVKAFGAQVSVPAVRREDVCVHGQRVSALLWGNAQPTLTLLHGAGLNAHTWDATLLALGGAVPGALALDLPGHGDSAWREDADYRPETIAGAASAAIQHWTQAPQALVGQTLIGQSLGGLTAAVIASQHPELVSRLVLIDITPGLKAAPGESNQVRDFLAGPSDFASRAEIVERALAFGFGPNRAAVERGVALNTRLNEHGRVIFKHHLANLREGQTVFASDFGTLWPALEGLQIPVLLISGERGFLTAADTREFLARVPHASAVQLSSGHNVQEDAPAALAEVLRDFIRQ